MNVELWNQATSLRIKLNKCLDDCSAHYDNKVDRRQYHFEMGRASAFADALNGTLKDLHISDFGDFPTLDSKG